jgi:elongation factor P
MSLTGAGAYGNIHNMNANELRPGRIFKMDGAIYQVVDYEFRQQPRLEASIKAKIKNIVTGAISEENFKGNPNLEEVAAEKKEMQFSYQDGDIYYFMDPETFETVPVNSELCADAVKYDSEGILYTFNTLDGNLFEVTPPTFVILEVMDTEPSVAGDTARNALKNAFLQGGITVKVPMFINNGDKVRVDTRTATYMDRA